MTPRVICLALTCCLSCSSFAQPAGTAHADSIETPTRSTEEIVIIGERSLPQLRLQMLAAEKNAYAIFNQFNDEKRFNITCSMQRPTGRHLEYQKCRPQFEIEATREHAQGYLDSYRTFLAPYINDKVTAFDGSSSPAVDVQTVITAQQGDYKQKIREVAQQHPEFLQAIIEYGEIRNRYEALTGSDAQ